MPATKKTMLIVAGEASADLLAASVVQQLRGNWQIFGIAGPHTREAGAELLYGAEDLGLVGLTEIVTAIPRVARMVARLYSAAVSRRPDVALLIDLPDFNFILGPLLRRLDIPIVYFGAPQAWAWRPQRARIMAGWVDELACLFPFEPAFFAKHDVNATFVGHPRAQRAIPSPNPPKAGDERTIVVLPGSRRSELRYHLPILADALPIIAERYPDHRIVLPVAPTLASWDITDALGTAREHVHVEERDALTLLQHADLALTASGTAVTECLLMHVPAVVFYRLSRLTYAIAHKLVRSPYIAITNILADEALLPELIQDAFTVEKLVEATDTLMEDNASNQALRQRLVELATELRGPKDGLTPASKVAQMVERAASA